MSWQKKLSHKFGSQKVTHAGRSFASKLEAALYDLLFFREKAGEIRDIIQQVSVSLSDAKIIYKPDFGFTDIKTETKMFAEAKGYETPEWRIKRRLWISYGPGPLEIWKGSYSRINLHETIVPKLDLE